MTGLLVDFVANLSLEVVEQTLDPLPCLELLKVSLWVVYSYHFLIFLFQDVSLLLMLATSCCWALLVYGESALLGAVMTGLLVDLVANLCLGAVGQNLVMLVDLVANLSLGAVEQNLVML